MSTRLPFIAAFLVSSLCSFTFTQALATDSETSMKSHVFELGDSIAPGKAKEVSVLLDESHLKLATITLRDGTALPPHSTPVPATIQVLVGEGVIHAGSRAVPVTQGTIVSLAAGEEHDVVPASGSHMLLLVHYLRNSAPEESSPATDHEH
ncbi:MAG: hypothetical protein K0U98_06645 [Deltaproteobacteria bacterium]|nr:hypothetical protein [Deltaproteobacteria bacterium]